MKKIFIIISFFLNFILIGGGLLLLYEKKILHKALRIIFYEGRVPYITPSYAMNRYYETRKALFKVQRDFDRPVLLLGDSHTAIPDWTALLGVPQIAARGIEGDTTLGLIARLRDYNDINSRNVVIWIGTNDVMQGEKANGVAKRIMEAARRKADILKKNFTTEDTEIFVMGIPPMATWVERGMERNATIREINALLAEGAKENGYQFIELESLLTDENGFLRGDMASDGVHLSAKGYEAVIHKLKDAGVWLVALNLPKAQLDLGMPVELWSVDSRSVAERAADSVGLAKSCLRPYPQSWPWWL
jgi:lysophospholipase L1-like esterase